MKNNHLQAIARLALVMGLVVVFGCQPAQDPAGQVSGTVSYQGTPLEDGIVSIVNYETGFRLDSEIQPDGTYLATTHKGGLPPGEYQVVIFPPEIADPNPPPNSEPGMIQKKMDNIPSKYRSPRTTPLSFTVGEGENTFDIDMSS